MGLLIDGFSETLKYEIKKQNCGFIGALLASSVVQLMTSSVVKGITGIGVIRTGRGYNNTDKSF